MHHATSKSESIAMTTIGAAVLVQSLIRYSAFVAITWLILSFADGWISAAISKL